ncbi:MAG: hypothetical protein ABI233_04425 [Chthoniobacterales bacterium]
MPLDIYSTVAEVGGSAVTIKTHDNDINSFDAWINERHIPNIIKQEAISHSRHGETLIYSYDAASLYYVCDISGELKSCLLCVREG